MQGRVGYGGFVALSLETYDFSRHLLPDANNKSPPPALARYSV